MEATTKNLLAGLGLLREQFPRKPSKQLPDTQDLLIKHLEQLCREGRTTVEPDF